MQLSKTNLQAQEQAQQIALVARFLWEKGWAEAGAGNISLDVSNHYRGIDMEFRTFPMISLPKPLKYIANHYIIVTRKGSRMRELAINPADNICLVKISRKGDGYQLMFEDPDHPNEASSEVLSHLVIHNMLTKKGASEKAVLHTHAHELIALTHLPEFQDEQRLNLLLWSMHTETVFFIPEGIGYVPFHVPGSQELATATLKALENHRVVIWEKHGCLAIGNDIHQAFDRIDILAKSAKIYWQCRTSGSIPEGLSEQQIRKMEN